ncbi:retrovirus-related pol polyprotein from transposon TNT 1-94 [Tanacetum coccineum]
MAKASPTQAWLWHRRLSHLNFDYINLLSKKDIVIGLPKLKDGENLDKMKEKEGIMRILVGYSTQSKGYRVYNKRTRLIVESITQIDEIKAMSETSVAKCPLQSIVSPTTKGVRLMTHLTRPQNYKCFSFSKIHSSITTELDLLLVLCYDEFFNDGAYRQQASLHSPTDKHYVHTRHNPSNEYSTYSNHRLLQTLMQRENTDDQAELPILSVHRRLVAKGYAQGIGYWITTNHLLQLLAWKLSDLFRIAHTQDLSNLPIGRKKRHFLMAMKEEVFMLHNPDGFVDPEHPDNKVYRLRKALYGLKLATKSWYDELSKTDIQRLFYKDFRSTIPTRFLSIGQYTLRSKNMYGKRTKHDTPMTTKPKLDADLSGEPVDQTDYRSKIGSLMYLTSSRPDIVQAVYADHAGCLDTRKSTSGGIQFLGDKLVSWMSKKQDCTAMSSAEAEYVALSASCAQHSRTKHIHTRYHFIKEQVENGIIELYFVRTEYQLADMFTKALPEERFQYLVRRIGMRCLTPAELEGRMLTKIELTLEQSQQGVSNDVLNIRVILFSIHNEDRILLEPTSNKLLVGDSNKLNLPDHRVHLKMEMETPHSSRVDSLPHAHAQTTKTYYKHQDSRIKKAQD